ncbi:hypothetical protein CR513_33079, partial [Mucuna pruriens]
MLAIQERPAQRQDPPITFTDEDYKGTIPHSNNPMVISVIIANYRVEKVLVDQGSLANILFWLAFQKLGFSESSLEECLRTFIDCRDAFAWTPTDMSSIDPDFLYHRLSISPRAHPVSQKKRRLGEEKKKGDLNKACPKDPYPLPSIDTLIDGASGCGLLSFMDAYISYNQIRIHLSDKSKTAFITAKGATY